MLTDVGTTTQAASEDPNNPEAVEPDAEVSFVTKDLATVLPKAKLAAVVALDEVLMRVRDAANWRGSGGVRYTSLANAAADASGAQSDLKLAYATEGNVSDPYAGFETRVVPENVTLLPKTKDQITGGNPSGERVHTVKKGDSIASILRDQGATPDEARAVALTLGPRGRDGGLKEGQKIRILMAPSGLGPAARLQPYRVIVANETTVEAVAALSDVGKYVAVDVQSMNTVAEALPARTTTMTMMMTAAASGSTRASTRPRCATRCRPPSSRTWSASIPTTSTSSARCSPATPSTCSSPARTKAPANEKDRGAVRSSPSAARPRNTIASRPPTIPSSTFYDETGKSAKKFLVRKPVNNAIMRSGFGGRRHPILGYTKMHTGVDWATPYGTPIFASGNGVVEKVGWEGGYGKYVRLKHNNGYETAYGHMSAFAKGMEPGKRVRQGQVIGFVGSTGMSTGAHVHYEILVNGRFVDPMRVKLPRGRSLEGPMMANFEKERDGWMG
jgi:murein DD-endopeptidase MepM/ murein hydrolase activator NlpD